MQRIGRALASLHHDRIHVPRVRRLQRALAELIPSGSATLLDVGAGDGTVAAGVAERVGARARGVEVKPRPAAIEVSAYDGLSLPFDDGSFDAVLLCDVLHHAADPDRLLAESLRVASAAVIVKDHFAFGFWSERLLWLMDVVGNAAPGVEVRGRYFTPASWRGAVRRAGARVSVLRWPLEIHDLPWRLVTRSELQFAARLVRGTP